MTYILHLLAQHHIGVTIVEAQQRRNKKALNKSAWE